MLQVIPLIDVPRGLPLMEGELRAQMIDAEEFRLEWLG